MGLFDWLTRSAENPNVSLSDPSAWINLFRRTSSGEVVSVETSMAIGALWACWRILSETMAGFHACVVSINDEGIEKLESHPYHHLLTLEPSPRYTAFTWMEAMMLNGLAHGVMYSEIRRNRSTGDAVEFIVHDSSRVTPIEDEFGRIYYQVQFSVGGQSRTKTLLAQDMIAIPIMSFNGLDTNGIIVKARDLLGEALAAQSLTADFMANGAMLDGILSTDVDLPKDKRKQLQDAWARRHQGSGNRGKTAILSNGLRYTPISANLQESQMLDLRTFYNQEVARIYNVPQHMIGELSRSTNNNIEQQALDFAKYTMRPYVTRWEQELKRKLFPASPDLHIQFNMDAILRADIESRAGYYNTMRMIGGMSQNEVRIAEGRNPIEGGDDYTPMMLAQTNPNGEGNEDLQDEL